MSAVTWVPLQNLESADWIGPQVALLALVFEAWQALQTSPKTSHVLSPAPLLEDIGEEDVTESFKAKSKRGQDMQSGYPPWN